MTLDETREAFDRNVRQIIAELQRTRLGRVIWWVARKARGARMTKLTARDVAAMCTAWERGDRLREIAARFGVALSTTSEAINGRRQRRKTEGAQHWTHRLPSRRAHLPGWGIVNARRLRRENESSSSRR